MFKLSSPLLVRLVFSSPEQQVTSVHFYLLNAMFVSWSVVSPISTAVVSIPWHFIIIIKSDFLQQHFQVEQEAMKGWHQISLIRMRKLHLLHKQEKPDTVADRANQMEIQIPLGVEVGRDQGTHDLHQTTRICLIESHHHHHQAIETGI